MYKSRPPEQMLSLACFAVARKCFGDLDRATVRQVAAEAGASEKQVHWWKDVLLEKGPAIFAALKPGRRKEGLSCAPPEEKPLVYETVNRLLLERVEPGLENGASKTELKRKMLAERQRLKADGSVTYEEFAQAVGVSARTLARWDRHREKEGDAGLADRSRAPKRRPTTLPKEVIEAIKARGASWRWSRPRKLTEFARLFRKDYGKLLSKYGKMNLSDKTIAKYLREDGLCAPKAENPPVRRGAYRYYFPGAQLLVDTTNFTFLGVKTKVISVMDAFSRVILYERAYLRETAGNVRSVLGTALAKAGSMGLKTLSVLSDHGRAYKAGAVREQAEGQGLLRIFAPPYRPQGKAPLERYFGKVKAALSGRWQALVFFMTGLLLAVKGSIAVVCLNLALCGFSRRYHQAPNHYIDGKSPAQRLGAAATGACEARVRAARTVLEDQAENSTLKGEIIDALCREFGWTMPRRKVHAYLERFRKESIDRAAEALRRKQVVAELDNTASWFYLSKVADNVERQLKEKNLEYARIALEQQAREAKERERRTAAQAQRRWDAQHPEQALEEAVEWRLVNWDNNLAFIVYDRLIREHLTTILMRHSRMTAGMRVGKLCQAIQSKNCLTHAAVIASGRRLPVGADLAQARNDIADLLRKTYSGCRERIPHYPFWRYVWTRPSPGLAVAAVSAT